jgi:hypothetical protein
LEGIGASIAILVQLKSEVSILRDQNDVFERSSLARAKHACFIHTEVGDVLGGAEFFEVADELSHTLANTV